MVLLPPSILPSNNLPPAAFHFHQYKSFHRQCGLPPPAVRSLFLHKVLPHHPDNGKSQHPRAPVYPLKMRDDFRSGGPPA